MFTIEFYENVSGDSIIFEMLKKLELMARTNRHERVRFGKIVEYMRILERYGTLVGPPVVRYMGRDLWELRPLSDRFFFFLANEHKYVMLHHYQKNGRKTPKRELSLAIAHMNNYIERNIGNA